MTRDPRKCIIQHNNKPHRCCIINNVSQSGSKGFQSCIMSCGGKSLLTFGSQVVLLIHRVYQFKWRLILKVWEAFANICFLGIIGDTFTERYTLGKSVPISVIKLEAPENLQFFVFTLNINDLISYDHS